MSEATENHTITNIGAGIAKAVMNSNPITGFVQTIYDEYASRQWQQRREKWEEVFTVINTIKNEDINNTKTHIFLNLLRDCTLLHIEILTEISKAKPPTSYNNSASNLLMDLRMKYKDDEILEAILKNLSENHLIYTALKTIGPTAPTILTDLGK